MNMLVIGNGFDIALGLPTKYTHFLNFSKKFIEFYLNSECEDTSKQAVMRRRLFINFFPIYGRAVDAPEFDMVCEDFYGCIFHNYWIDFFQEEYSDKLICGENWIDLELEIKSIIEKLADDVFDKHVGNINEGRNFPFLEQNYSEYPSISFMHIILSTMYNYKRSGSKISISIEEYNELKSKLRYEFDKFVLSLGIYLDFFVRNITCKEKSVDIEEMAKKGKIDCVLSFNYINNYYDKYHVDVQQGDNTCYIHGEATYLQNLSKYTTLEVNTRIHQYIENNNMIIGCDEYLDNDKKDVDLEFVYYKKFFQRIYKGTGSQYLNWLDRYKVGIKHQSRTSIDIKKVMETYESLVKIKAEETPNHVYIFGHSLDATDGDIFRDIFLRDPNDTKVTIYYHNNDALDRIITNLIRILSQDVLIQKTHSLSPNIEFRKQT